MAYDRMSRHFIIFSYYIKLPTAVDSSLPELGYGPQEEDEKRREAFIPSRKCEKLPVWSGELDW